MRREIEALHELLALGARHRCAAGGDEEETAHELGALARDADRRRTAERVAEEDRGLVQARGERFTDRVGEVTRIGVVRERALAVPRQVRRDHRAHERAHRIEHVLVEVPGGGEAVEHDQRWMEAIALRAEQMHLPVPRGHVLGRVAAGAQAGAEERIGRLEEWAHDGGGTLRRQDEVCEFSSLAHVPVVTRVIAAHRDSITARVGTARAIARARPALRAVAAAAPRASFLPSLRPRARGAERRSWRACRVRGRRESPPAR